MDIEKRNQILTRAIESGRILAAAAATWARHYENDAEATEATIARLAASPGIAAANKREVGDVAAYLEVSLGQFSGG